MTNLPFRWEARIVEYPETGCWLWIGAMAGKYGVTCVAGRQTYAHRALYEYFREPIPEGLVIDHLCRVSCCVNPDHLEAVTQKENILRGNAGKHTVSRHADVRACPRGHVYDERNTGKSQVGIYTVRYCRTCKRDKAAERRARNEVIRR